MAYDGKTVDLEVRTRDTWTLNPGINFSRQGGANSSSIELEEKNLLGNGQKLAFGWSNDVDRDVATISSSSIRTSTRRGHGSAWSTATPTTAAPRRCASTARSMPSTRAAPAAATCSTRSATSRATPTATRSASSSSDEQFAEALRRLVARLGRRLGPAVDRRRDLSPEAVRRGRRRSPRRTAAGGHRTRLPVAGVRPGRGRLRGAHEPGPDRAHGGRAARLARRRTHRLRGRGAGIGSRRADAERLRAERLGPRPRALAVRDHGRDRPRRGRRLAQWRAVGRGPVLRADLGQHQVLRDRQRRRDRSARRGPAAAARRRRRPARLSAALPGRHVAGAADARGALLHRTGIRSACSTWRAPPSSTWGAPGAPT